MFNGKIFAFISCSRAYFSNLLHVVSTRNSLFVEQNALISTKTPMLDFQCSKPLGDFKVDSAFHPSEVDKMSTRISGNLVIKSKLPPQSCLEAVELHP